MEERCARSPLGAFQMWYCVECKRKVVALEELFITLETRTPRSMGAIIIDRVGRLRSHARDFTYPAWLETCVSRQPPLVLCRTRPAKEKKVKEIKSLAILTSRQPSASSDLVPVPLTLCSTVEFAPDIASVCSVSSGFFECRCSGAASRNLAQSGEENS